MGRPESSGRQYSLEERIYRLETELQYYKPQISKEIRDLQDRMEYRLSNLQAEIQELRLSTFRDPRMWLLVILGAIGGGLVFISAMWIALRMGA